MGDVPQSLLAAWAVIGMFVGDVLKKWNLNDWLIPINMALGGIVSCLMMGGGWTFDNFIIGMAVGSGASGLHGLRKTVARSGGGQ